MDNHSYDESFDFILSVARKQAVNKAYEVALMGRANRKLYPYLSAIEEFGEALSGKIPAIYESIANFDIKPIDETYLEQKMLGYADECFVAVDAQLKEYKVDIGSEYNIAYEKVREKIVTGNNVLKARFRNEIEQKKAEQKKRINEILLRALTFVSGIAATLITQWLLRLLGWVK